MRIKSQPPGLCILLLLLFAWQLAAPLARAQEVDEKEKSQKELEKRQELEHKTLALLDDVINGAWSLKVPENRSFVLVNAADLLWPHDEKRARSLFWEALNNLNLTNAPVADAAAKEPATNSAEANDAAKKSSPASSTANPKPLTKEQTQELNRYYEMLRKRRDFLIKVAARDSQLALDMLRATHQQPPPWAPGLAFIPGDNDLEEEIAGAAASRDPKRALQLARQSLAKGLSFQLMTLLFQLNQQDQNAASEFAADIISKINDENLGSNAIALLVASQLLARSRTGGAVLSNNVTAEAYKPLNLADEQKRDLVEKITDAALSVTAQLNTLQNVRFLMPEIEKYAPDRAPRVKARLAEWNRTLNKEQQDWDTFNTLYESATPEEMIKAADKLGDQQRESLYRGAVSKAADRGQSDALREFINSQIEDESRKKSLLELMDTEQAYAALYQGKTDDAQKLLPLIRQKEQRALAMCQLAIMLEKKGEHDSAVKLLDDARGLIKLDLKNEAQSNVLLTLMLAYTLVEPDKAFQLIAPVIDRANEDISRLLLLDKIAKTGATRNGEILLQQPNLSLDLQMLRYSSGIVALANADFNQTKSLADRFERNELRVLARLFLVQSLLRHQEHPATTS